MHLSSRWPSEKPTKSHEAIVSDRRGQKYIKMRTIHENALMRLAIDHDIGSIFPMVYDRRWSNYIHLSGDSSPPFSGSVDRRLSAACHRR